MITAILIVTAIALVLLQYFSLKRPLNFPPGPSGIPLLGYAPFIRSPFYEGFEELSKKYGKIFGMFVGTCPVVVLCDLKLLKEAFGNEGMSGRQQIGLFEDFSYGGGRTRGIGLSTGRVSQEQRRFAMKNLREFGFARASMETMIMEEVMDLINGLKMDLNRPIRVNNLFLKPVLNILWYIISGERGSSIASHIHKITDVIAKKIGTTRAAGLYAIPGLAKAFPKLSGYKCLHDSVSEAYSFLKASVDTHKAVLDVDNPRDFIDAYLKAIVETTNPESSFWKEEGEKQLLTVLLDLNIAGGDTTASTLNWALLYLVTYPDIQEKIHNEIVAVIGTNRIPSLADRPRMPYIEALMAETMRFSSFVPTGIPHWTTETVELNGYTIPKNSIVLANIRQIHFDKERWGDPETFCPERFIDRDGLFRPNEGLIPFSVGKRMCPGENLAKVQLFLFLAGLTQQFRFGMDRNNISTLQPEPSPIIRQPQPYNVIISNRNSV